MVLTFTEIGLLIVCSGIRGKLDCCCCVRICAKKSSSISGWNCGIGRIVTNSGDGWRITFGVDTGTRRERIGI